MKQVIEIMEIETAKTIKEIDVTGKSERQIEKIEMGILRQLDRDRFCMGLREQAVEK